MLLAGGTLKGLSLDGKDDATTALRTEARGPLGGTRAIPVARQADVQLDVDEPEDGVVRLRLWSLP